MFTHLDDNGRSKMVDVSDKKVTKRIAKASGKIFMQPETISKITNSELPKGNVLNTAQVAGVMAVKNTANIIPMCHCLNVEGCDIDFIFGDNFIEVVCSAYVTGKTGIEMEAITGVSAALLTVYDMCKAVDKEMEIGNISLIEKIGGKSGHYIKGGNNG